MSDLFPFSISSGLLPHGQCLLWESGLLWLHVIADSGIVLAYYSIPLILAYFAKKRTDLSFDWIFYWFSAFIFACGTTHLISIWTLWQPDYLVEGLIKVVTAVLSIGTAILLIKLVPQALTWPSPTQLEAINEELRFEIAQRRWAEEELCQATKKLEALVAERTSELTLASIESKRTSDILQESKAQFVAFAEVAPVGIFYCDKNGLVTYVNQRLIEMIGLTSQEEVRMGWGDMLHPEDRDKVLARWDHTVETGQPFRSEHRFNHSNGQVVWVLGQASAVLDDGGSIMGIVGTLTDITEDKEKEEQFRLVVESAPCGMVMVNAEGRITLINAQIEALFGYSRSELLGNCIEQLIPGRFRNAHPDMRTSYSHAPTVRSMGKGRDLFGLRKNGTEFAVEVGLNPIRRDDGVFILATIVDITERKQAEQQLAQQAAELTRSNHELEQFAYVASHDLQEPLRMVASYCGLLSRRYKGKIDQDADEFIDFAVDGAQRMKALIDDLLTYSRVGRRGMDFVASDATKIVQLALSNLKMVIKEKDAVIQCDPLPTVLADQTQLVQVFQNLIGNALKFCREQPPVIRISASRLSGGKNVTRWQFSVQDNGIGFDQQYGDRVFVIFQRLHTRAEHPGNGMGLAIVKKIIERHDGKIWVESTPGSGTTFFFTLNAPVAEESVAA